MHPGYSVPQAFVSSSSLVILPSHREQKALGQNLLYTGIHLKIKPAKSTQFHNSESDMRSEFDEVLLVVFQGIQRYSNTFQPGHLLSISSHSC